LIRPARSFEDLALGERRTSATRTVTQDEIIEFARHYDPQWFHSDVEAAKDSHFGEVVASGIHVLALWRQMDHEINSDIDFVCGVGFDELRLKSALRSGDTVYVTSEITDLAPSKSGKDRGTAITRYAMIKQTGEVVVTFDSINLVYTRAARATS
jgi:acyl dehydratase